MPKIGSAVLLHLTSGLYPDPRDPIREYIQNSVDSGASQVVVRIEDDRLIIEDNGTGMTKASLQAALNIAISTKVPNENVGYKGIGIYSALTYAESLRIITVDETTLKKSILRLDLSAIEGEINSGSDVTLEKLISDNSDLGSEGTKNSEAFFPNGSLHGTIVELQSLSEKAIHYYEDIEGLNSYLEKTVPLGFNPEFPLGEAVQEKINEVCKEHGWSYRTVRLHIESGGQSYDLFRPYDDTYDVQEPIFELIKSKSGQIFGIAWGCMSVVRKMFKQQQTAKGFFFKKHGFSIGNQAVVLKHFPQGVKFFNRYIGELLILHDGIHPNSSRSEIEYSESSDEFLRAVTLAAKKYEILANNFQENDITRELTERANTLLGAEPKDFETLVEIKRRLEDKIFKIKLEEQIKEAAKEAVSEINKAIGDMTEVEDNPADEDDGENGSDVDVDVDSSDNDKVGKQRKRSLGGVDSSDEIKESIRRLEQAIPDDLQYGAQKLRQLYNSLMVVSLSEHACFCCMGAVSFIEILAKLAWGSDVDLDTKIKQEIRNRPYANKNEMQNAWASIREGHEVKHSIFSCPETGIHLRQKFATLENFIIDVIEIAAKGDEREDG